jgi:dUTP pyrophosphatase
MKYKVGDEVRVMQRYNRFYNEVGIIKSIDSSDYPYTVVFDGEDRDKYEDVYMDEHLVPTRTRGFEAVTGYEEVTLPTRATRGSAGYDLAVAEDVILAPGESKVFSTGLCAYMLSDEYLAIHVRSSLGIKHRITLSNATGIVDSDYIQSDNGGHIMMALTNNGSDVFQAAKGDRVAQGIFMKYLVADGDNVTAERNGGIGSTTH